MPDAYVYICDVGVPPSLLLISLCFSLITWYQHVKWCGLPQTESQQGKKFNEKAGSMKRRKKRAMMRKVANKQNKQDP